ncbi:Aste57867_534 [Aphanomyces stellatus]|uniref:Aste57867_534 protein n=1 Tax=Aphanomyces stellatus TaxID=120398 RepID=A0A485K3V3_9STRA|nr:hypothetical protein As57867_000533 [Aphanomyces stellatus]VFT77759.1 Aste57867_534 [Aphanomyces stellatus]
MFLWVLIGALVALSTDVNAAYRNIITFKEWSTLANQGDFQMFDVNWALATHVKYGFANPLADGTVTLANTTAAIIRRYMSDPPNVSPTDAIARGSFGLANSIKRQFRNTKFGLSIGGELNSANFSALANTDAGRQTFATTAVALIQNLGLDFVDINWAYQSGGIPTSPNDAQNYIKLLQAVRAQLQTLPFSAELTTVVPSTTTGFSFIEDPYTVCDTVDHAHLASYDLGKLRVLDPFENGRRRRLANATTPPQPYSNYVAHQSNLYIDKNDPNRSKNSIDTAVAFYRNGNCNLTKLVVGVPAYGRTFENTPGLYGNFTPATQGSFVYRGTGLGQFTYKSLPLNGATEMYDAAVGATYSYDPNQQLFTSYEGPQSLAAKLAYVQANKLGGTMFWSADGDVVSTQPRSLIAQAHSTYGTNLASVPNTVDYPNSAFVNIRAPATPAPTTASPTPTTSVCSGHAGGVCVWPLTRQVVLYWNQAQCLTRTDVFVWCP